MLSVCERCQTQSSYTGSVPEEIPSCLLGLQRLDEGSSRPRLLHIRYIYMNTVQMAVNPDPAAFRIKHTCISPTMLSTYSFSSCCGDVAAVPIPPPAGVFQRVQPTFHRVSLGQGLEEPHTVCGREKECGGEK